MPRTGLKTKGFQHIGELLQHSPTLDAWLDIMNWPFSLNHWNSAFARGACKRIHLKCYVSMYLPWLPHIPQTFQHWNYMWELSFDSAFFSQLAFRDKSFELETWGDLTTCIAATFPYLRRCWCSVRTWQMLREWRVASLPASRRTGLWSPCAWPPAVFTTQAAKPMMGPWLVQDMTGFWVSDVASWSCAVYVMRDHAWHK